MHIVEVDNSDQVKTYKQRQREIHLNVGICLWKAWERTKKLIGNEVV